VILIPNPNSIVATEWGWLFTPYANTLGMNTTWQFFSPDPSLNMYFPYEIQVANGEPVSGRWPPAREEVPHMLLENYRRIFYHSLYTTIAPERVENFLVPFLCKRVPGALSIFIRTIIEDVPPIEKSRVDRKDFAGLRFEMRNVDQEYPCPN